MSKSTLYLYWYKLNNKNGNFGDELNWYIISKLSGIKVEQVIIPKSNFQYVISLFSILYNQRVSLNQFVTMLQQIFKKEFIVAIGSVLHIVNSKHAKIWGSGIISKNEIIHKANFYAVRGKYTQQRMRNLGLMPPVTIGDPALLLPILYKKETIKKYKIGIIPHYKHYDEIKKKIIYHEDILIIDLLNKIEDVIDQILSCEMTISSSLHGIIVSHAYNIKSLWCILSSIDIVGDNIKFYDYFSSVEIEEYSPIEVDLNNLDITEICYVINSMQKSNIIQNNLKIIQNELLHSAPFSILPKF